MTFDTVGTETPACAAIGAIVVRRVGRSSDVEPWRSVAIRCPKVSFARATVSRRRRTWVDAVGIARHRVAEPKHRGRAAETFGAVEELDRDRPMPATPPMREPPGSPGPLGAPGWARSLDRARSGIAAPIRLSDVEERRLMTDVSRADRRIGGRRARWPCRPSCSRRASAAAPPASATAAPSAAPPTRRRAAPSEAAAEPVDHHLVSHPEQRPGPQPVEGPRRRVHGGAPERHDRHPGQRERGVQDEAHHAAPAGRHARPVPDVGRRRSPPAGRGRPGQGHHRRHRVLEGHDQRRRARACTRSTARTTASRSTSAWSASGTTPSRSPRPASRRRRRPGTSSSTTSQTLKAKGITPIALAGKDTWTGAFYWAYLAVRNCGQAGHGQGRRHR